MRKLSERVELTDARGIHGQGPHSSSEEKRREEKPGLQIENLF